MSINDYINERVRIHDEATEGQWETSQNEGQEATTFLESGWQEVLVHDERGTGHMRENYSWMKCTDATAIVDAHNEAPKAWAALKSVLEKHKSRREFNGRDYCAECYEDHGFDGAIGVLYPCPTVVAITADLGVEL